MVTTLRHEMMVFSVCKSEDITYDAVPSPQHPTQYEDGLIECRVSGQPIPTVSWRYRGQRIHTGMLLHNYFLQLARTLLEFWCDLGWISPVTCISLSGNIIHYSAESLLLKVITHFIITSAVMGQFSKFLLVNFLGNFVCTCHRYFYPRLNMLAEYH